MPRGLQIGFYESCDLAKILQVALFAARDVRDMPTPDCSAVFGGVLLEPDLNDE